MHEILEICKGDEKYPSSFNGIKDAPETLYCMGNLDILDMNSIAIVGKRDASERYLGISYNLGKCAAELGMVVINGLALGCDKYAIDGALSTGGKVVVVMPGGLDVITPAAHKTLVEKILDGGGCVVSEYPLGTKPERYRYVQRDRIQAYLSHKVFVVCADSDGGTMHTVKFAAKVGVPIGCFMENGIADGNILISQKYGVVVKDKTMFADFAKKERYLQLSLV